MLQSDYSMVNAALQYGGVVKNCVDLETGELLPLPGREEASGEARPGLSTVHNSPQGRIEFCLGASYVKVEKPKTKPYKVVGGKRGRVKGFTKSSRRRMLRKLSQVDRRAIPVMVTLTYPGDYPSDPKKWKRHLDNFCKRLKRRFPAAGGFWKLEPQKRGAPHFHLLVWGVVYRVLLAWVSRAWYEVVGSGDIRHLYAGTRVEPIRNIRGLFAYASKYLGKEVAAMAGWEAVGRYWGVFGGDNIPWGSLVEVSVSYPEAVHLIRLMRRAINAKGRDYPSLTGIQNADFWFDRIDRLLEGF